MGVETEMSAGDGGGGFADAIDDSTSSFDWGALASSAGSFIAANQDLKQAQANSEIAKYNANVADQNAAQAEAMGEENARRSLVASSKLVAAGRASYAAAGVSGGSVNDVLRAGAAQGELDALTIKYNAGVKANAFRNEAALDRYKAENQSVAGGASAAGDIMRGVASAAVFVAALA